MSTHNRIAGGGKRFLAYLIDILPIILIVFGVFYFFFGFDETLRAYFNRGDMIEPRVRFLRERNWIREISFLLWLVYCVFMESSARQGTYGKSLMGIKVVDAHGERLTLGKAIGRNISKILSFIVLGLGFLWILFDKTKQGWHDKISNTFVVETGDIIA